MFFFVSMILKFTWQASHVEFSHKPAQSVVVQLISFNPHWSFDWIGTSTSRKYRKFPEPWVSPHPVTNVRSPSWTKSLFDDKQIERINGLNINDSVNWSKAISCTHRVDFPLYIGYY